jgi:adenosylcobinamide kinase/adenosylcobinamide-phosphate guanylyltransferase
MAERVRLHKESRGTKWTLLEESIEISDALLTRCNDFEAVLIDCLTVWLSNVLLKMGGEEIGLYQDRFLKTLSKRRQAIIMVSNEVGTGIVPEYAMGRRFRDLAGLLNQNMAAMADKVIFMIAGIPTYLKGHGNVNQRPPVELVV